MATNGTPVEETCDNTNNSRRRPGRTNYGGNNHVLLRDRISAHSVTSSDHRYRQSSYANKYQDERPTDQPNEEPVMLTPRQETDEENCIPPLSLLRIDHPERETSLQPLLKPFTSLVDYDLYLFSPPPSPLLQDRVDSTVEYYFSFHSRLGSLEGKEVTMQSEEAVGGVWGLRERQDRVMSQGSSGSEVVRGVSEAAQTKAVGTHALRDIL